MEQVQTDVLIVGSGIAGLYTALQLAGKRRVLLVSEGPLGAGNTRLAQGGIAAALGPDDDPALHAADTLAAGAGHCDAAAVRVLVEEGPGCLYDLVNYGIPFARAGRSWQLAQEAAHSRRRIAYVADATGEAVQRGLVAAATADRRLHVRAGYRLVQLLTGEGRCYGALLRDAAGRPVTVLASYVVLATGGLGQLYRLTTNSPQATGAGMVLAYEAGAALTDLEFIQFHPTALWHAGRAVALVTEALRGEGAVLRNTAGDRFMLDYDPRGELAPRDIVARAVHEQLQRGGERHVWLDARHLGARIRERFPTVTAACARIGLDPAVDMIPVVPAAHYSMGGIYTDLFGRTTLPGLLAVGEAACTGVHGANRLASNSLLEGLVFGKRAAAWLSEAPLAVGSRHSVRNAPLFADVANPATTIPPGADTAEQIWHSVQSLMWDRAGLVRSEQSLRQAEQQLGQYGTRRHPGVTLARLLIAAALQRRESRGAHFRRDCPQPVPEWAGRRLLHSIAKSEEVMA